MCLPDGATRLIMGSSGLWSAIHWQEAAQVTRRATTGNAAALLVREAASQQRCPTEDVTALVVDLLPPTRARFPRLVKESLTKRAAGSVASCRAWNLPACLTLGLKFPANLDRALPGDLLRMVAKIDGWDLLESAIRHEGARPRSELGQWRCRSAPGIDQRQGRSSPQFCRRSPSPEYRRGRTSPGPSRGHKTSSQNGRLGRKSQEFAAGPRTLEFRRCRSSVGLVHGRSSPAGEVGAASHRGPAPAFLAAQRANLDAGSGVGDWRPPTGRRDGSSLGGEAEGAEDRTRNEMESIGADRKQRKTESARKDRKECKMEPAGEEGKREMEATGDDRKQCDMDTTPRAEGMPEGGRRPGGALSIRCNAPRAIRLGGAAAGAGSPKSQQWEAGAVASAPLSRPVCRGWEGRASEVERSAAEEGLERPWGVEISAVFAPTALAKPGAAPLSDVSAPDFKALAQTPDLKDAASDLGAPASSFETLEKGQEHGEGLEALKAWPEGRSFAQCWYFPSTALFEPAWPAMERSSEESVSLSSWAFGPKRGMIGWLGQ
eukprot:evm.model.scf_1092.3 EVM.evm.TU.scf_1092.3   scf_1092:33914-35554(-)